MLLTWGMRLLCLLLAAVSASAAEMDINAPGFWSKTYSIPRAYCERRIALDSPSVENLVKSAAPCKFSIQNGGVRSDCRVTRKESDRIVGKLRRLGTLTAYEQNCNSPADYPELYYKRDNLRREREETPFTGAPAINGLLEAQLSTLEQLISAHETALQTLLTITITGAQFTPSDGVAFVLTYPSGGRDEKSRYYRVAKIAHRIGSPERPSAEDWARRSLSACQQIEPITVVFGMSGGPEDARRLAAARSLGETYVDPGCGLLSDPGLASAIFSTRPETEIRKILMGLPGVRAWRVGAPGGSPGSVPDDRRYVLLSAERVAKREVLARAPHIRSLVAAEMARVSDNAQRLWELRKGRLLLIRFEP